jgi:uncharacterized protein YndB with AHSA1/START domain
MTSIKRQAVIDAPVEEVWSLVGDPRRHPEWFPRVVEVNGQRFEEGQPYAQVTKQGRGTIETDFVIERLENMREIRFACQQTGMYAHWLLTDAQGDTFVDVEMGMQPRSTGDKVFDAVLGRLYFRRWLDQSLDALRGRLAKTRSRGRAL